jgi:hypothetical protein
VPGSATRGPSIPKAPPATSTQAPPPDGSEGTGADVAHEGGVPRTGASAPCPLPEGNAERGSATFEAEGEQTKQRIAAPRSSAIAPAPDILRPFDASDPAFIAEERKLRWGKKRA